MKANTYFVNIEVSIDLINKSFKFADLPSGNASAQAMFVASGAVSQSWK